MRDPSRVGVAGPLEPYAEGFGGELAGQGYSPGAVVVHLQVMGHLSGWLAGQGLSGSALTPAVVDAYVAERRSARCANHRTSRALAPLLGFLRRQEVAPVPPSPTAPVEMVLGRYARWLAAERGLAETTIQRNVELVGPFVAGWERAGLGPIHAHRLRHTAATGMLRGGGSLLEIGQVLRHRHTLTTAIYAKVDLDALRLLARPWPRGAA